jgi:Reverse transcriptase (RNA-dependent DNA polymerase)
VISKVYEKIAGTRLIQYLDANKILDRRQYDFRNKSNTEGAPFDLVNRIQTLKQKKQKVGKVFYDLHEAFDTVYFEILLEILQYIGQNGTDLSWFRSYLCGVGALNTRKYMAREAASGQ